MRKANILRLSLLPMLAAGAATIGATGAAAQENPASKPHDMNHMQHSHDGFMQGGMHHATAKGVKLEQKIDGQTITVRVGPLTLPAHTSHMKMPQPADLIWQIPVNGWLLAYHPKLVDANGNTVPGIVLHHVAFWNENRPDFLCANKEEHIFGAGSELTDWAEIPGFGYRVEQGDKIRVETMVHNPTETSYDNAYLEVTIPYRDAGGAPVKSVYPAWMDVMACGNSGYDLPAGESEKTGGPAEIWWRAAGRGRAYARLRQANRAARLDPESYGGDPGRQGRCAGAPGGDAGEDVFRGRRVQADGRRRTEDDRDL